jgi:hypothetical protein
MPKRVQMMISVLLESAVSWKVGFTRGKSRNLSGRRY